MTTLGASQEDPPPRGTPLSRRMTPPTEDELVNIRAVQRAFENLANQRAAQARGEIPAVTREDPDEDSDEDSDEEPHEEDSSRRTSQLALDPWDELFEASITLALIYSRYIPSEVIEGHSAMYRSVVSFLRSEVDAFRGLQRWYHDPQRTDGRPPCRTRAQWESCATALHVAFQRECFHFSSWIAQIRSQLREYVLFSRFCRELARDNARLSPELGVKIGRATIEIDRLLFKRMQEWIKVTQTWMAQTENLYLYAGQVHNYGRNVLTACGE